MTVSLNTTEGVHTSIETIAAVKTAKLAQSQTEKEGQMALDLIQSAAINLQSIVPPSGNSGFNVNIKV